MFFALSKVLSHSARYFFFLAGKHVDMVTTIKGLKLIRSDAISTDGDDYMPPDNATGPRSRSNGDGVSRHFEPIMLAISYSQAAYDQQMLPKEEVLKIDKQAQVMAKALGNVLEAKGGAILKSDATKTADEYFKACSLHAKYHQSGKEKHKMEAMLHLARADDRRCALENECAGSGEQK
ncbi:hypothetical protein ACFL6Y_07480 [Elusimicrobiota bacterium]